MAGAMRRFNFFPHVMFRPQAVPYVRFRAARNPLVPIHIDERLPPPFEYIDWHGNEMITPLEPGPYTYPNGVLFYRPSMQLLRDFLSAETLLPHGSPVCRRFEAGEPLGDDSLVLVEETPLRYSLQPTKPICAQEFAQKVELFTKRKGFICGPPPGMNDDLQLWH